MKKSILKSRLQQLVVAHFAIVVLVIAGIVSGVTVQAKQTEVGVDCPTDTTAVNFKNGTKCAKPTGVVDNLTGSEGVFAVVANILLFLVGAVAVIMLIIGGLRYVTSNGDQNAVTGAKNTIMYAIIGIIVAFLAYAGVQFVTSQLTVGTGVT